MTTTIVWFRRDLRIEDNPALIAAARGGPVVPVFIWSPEEEGQFFPGRVSRWWLKQSLQHLDASLQALGSGLVMHTARNTLAVLLEIVKITGATHVFYNHLYDPVSLVRDHKVKQGLAQAGLTVHTFNADLLYEPWEVYEEDSGQAFTTFQSFWQKCQSMPFQPDPPLPAPASLEQPKVWPPSLVAEDLRLEDDQEKASNALLARAWIPGWSNADRALLAFMSGPLIEYASNGAKADSGATSLLSPHIHFGEVSVRKIYHEARRLQAIWRKDSVPGGAEGVDKFLRAMGFREYSRYLSFNFPFTHERSLLANLKSFPWRIDEVAFKAWRQGRTGYPFVDAGMRELWATGWLHNRTRVVVSNFCVKFLQLPWRWGMKYFWDALLDADLECDVLGWQYISGSLPDGHELERMEDPQAEGYKYDPEGEYVRRWLPELSRVPSEWIHHPWDAPSHVLWAAGVELGVNYPRPIVEMSVARERLQDSLSVMWEREAAHKAAEANGVEEGLGDTMEVACATGGADHEKMEVHRAVIVPPGGDQMVPSLPMAPSEAAQVAARSIMNQPVAANRQERVAVAEAALARGRQPVLAAPLDSDKSSPTPTPAASPPVTAVATAMIAPPENPPTIIAQCPDEPSAPDCPPVQSAAPLAPAVASSAPPPVAPYAPYNQARQRAGNLLIGGPQPNPEADVDSTAESCVPHRGGPTGGGARERDPSQEPQQGATSAFNAQPAGMPRVGSIDSNIGEVPLVGPGPSNWGSFPRVSSAGDLSGDAVAVVPGGGMTWQYSNMREEQPRPRRFLRARRPCPSLQFSAATAAAAARAGPSRGPQEANEVISCSS
eukprot:TRINITY_DN4828_c0_g1_i1.p1 TRINITY_DN4828_c0_g1~~TRINITY_DN4828_c0_g1_i1.p1  ORF type:complete len:833 (-),score=126.92 TRINITY_DN4828_c0_g1_i1:1769-4267(-)